MLLLSRQENEKIIRAALYILELPVEMKRPLPMAEAFLDSHPCYEALKTVAERLKWCRYQKNMTRESVCQLLGISLDTYEDLENGTTSYIPTNLGRQLSAIFGVPEADLIDPYSAFLESGQGKQIRSIRAHLHLSRKDFAARLGIRTNMLRRWEQEENAISKSKWQQYFQNLT